MAIFPGESLTDGPCPLLVYSRPGKPNRRAQPDADAVEDSFDVDQAPLVVFLPGAIHSARIGYGHDGCAPTDFLGHWITEAGHPFMAISYPVQPRDRIFRTLDADLGLRTVVEAAGEVIADHVASAGLPGEVIVVAWSALGNAAPGLNRALARRGVHLSTFVALASTPPLPNLILGSLDAAEGLLGAAEAFDSDGLLRHAALRSDDFLAEIEIINATAGRSVLSLDDYRDHYLGDMALHVFPGLEARRVDGRLQVDHAAPLAESIGAQWADYPICASIGPTSPTDARHVITDRANWAMVTANVLQWAHVAPAAPRELAPRAWERVRRVCDWFGSELHRTLPGGHFLFVGESGARATAEAVLDLAATRTTLMKLLDSALSGEAEE